MRRGDIGSRSHLLAVLAAIALFTAGCLGGGDPAPAPPEAEEPPREPEVTQTQGAIRGTVASTLFEPLSGARVDLLDAQRKALGKSAVTGKDGAFVFNELEPASYVLAAARTGYSSQQRAAVVEAGKVTQAQFRLEADRTVDPYVIEEDRVGLHAYGYAWHVEVPGEGCTSVDVPGYGTVPTCGSRNPFNSESWHDRFEIDNSTETILVEMMWTPATPEGGNLWLDLYCEDVRHLGLNTNAYYGQVSDPEHACYFPPDQQTSPAVIRVDAEHWRTNNYSYLNWEWRVVPGYGLMGGGAADAGAIYQQDFTLFFSVFQNGAAPPGYSRLPDA